MATKHNAPDPLAPDTFVRVFRAGRYLTARVVGPSASPLCIRVQFEGDYTTIDTIFREDARPFPTPRCCHRS
jgi:hypothetical protein